MRLAPALAFAITITLTLALAGGVRATERGDEAAADEAPLSARDRAHWAYRPLRSSDVARDGTPARDARSFIDLHVDARLASAGLVPLPDARRAALIRRVTFDLTGLPPSPDEIRDFVADDSPDAFERLLDRLLASPAFGERQGQHWLDLARFAETDGFEHDNLRPEAWRYRDWVIDAINRDLPWDEFVRLQIAGDRLHPESPAAIVATGFALCGPDMPDINSQDERRHTVLNEMTSTVGAVFLGLRVQCAQCHDHKSDPISQADFYRLRAFFEQVEIFRDHPIATAIEREALARRQLEWEGEKQARRSVIESTEGVARAALADDGAESAKAKELSAELIERALGAEARRRWESAKDELRRLERRPPRVTHGRVLREGEDERVAHLMVRGNFRSRGPRVDAAVPRIADDGRVSLDHDADPRPALARWITSPDNALALRVTANRFWQRLFGRGLVRTPSDFGILGDEPSHHALLDRLALELVRLEWSPKRVVRAIARSSAYRRASLPSAGDVADSPGSRAWRAALERDPENRLLARQNRKRLEAEAIRDALLAASGRLSTRRGGRGVMPPLPMEIRKSIRRDHWTVSPNREDHHRRSIYLFVRRNLRYPFFEVFDRPDTNFSCARRNETTIAPQSLAMLNSDLTVESARFLAGRVRDAGRSLDERIEFLWLATLGRRPTASEIDFARDFVTAAAAELEAEGRAPEETAAPLPASEGDAFRGAALTSLCLALLNANEFIYVD